MSRDVGLCSLVSRGMMSAGAVLVSRGVGLCSLVSRDLVSAEAVLVSRGVGLCSLVSRDLVSAEPRVIRGVTKCCRIMSGVTTPSWMQSWLSLLQPSACLRRLCAHLLPIVRVSASSLGLQPPPHRRSPDA